MTAHNADTGPRAACGSCRFFVAEAEADPTPGSCWRFPPVVYVGEMGRDELRPRVKHIDWCGEWQAGEWGATP